MRVVVELVVVAAMVLTVLVLMRRYSYNTSVATVLGTMWKLNRLL